MQRIAVYTGQSFDELEALILQPAKKKARPRRKAAA